VARLAQDRPARLACRPQHAPDRHPHPTRSASSRLASLQVIGFISLSRMFHVSLDARLSPVLSPVAPARRSPSLSTIDGRLSLGLFEPDSAGGANLQVDRALEPRPCPEPSAYRRRAALSDARLPVRSSASEAVKEIALWRVPGTCAICASAEIAGHTQCLHGTPGQLQPLSGQCMGGLQHASLLCFSFCMHIHNI
jgi:hypothetical protein